MLSILIPVYNYDVQPLVKQLVAQAQACKVPYEILCYDDCSEQAYKALNTSLSSLSNVDYLELDKNHGRSKIRNLLAAQAKYDYLLFLDCDSGMVRDNFLEVYIEHMDSTSDIIAGGRVYDDSPPTDSSLRLHWLYGSTKESRPLHERQASPCKYFHSNNFLIRRASFDKVKFVESIGTYGYEDLVFAEQARKSGIGIRHIDNPIEHLCLESNSRFLEKAKAAIDNLISLENNSLQIETNLTSVANRLKKTGLAYPFLKYYKWRENSVQKNLHSENPRLRSIDMYKLNYYLSKK